MVIRRIGVLNCIFHALASTIQQLHEKDTESCERVKIIRISCYIVTIAWPSSGKPAPRFHF